jgi:hypothetical protein
MIALDFCTVKMQTHLITLGTVYRNDSIPKLTRPPRPKNHAADRTVLRPIDSFCDLKSAESMSFLEKVFGKRKKSQTPPPVHHHTDAAVASSQSAPSTPKTGAHADPHHHSSSGVKNGHHVDVHAPQPHAARSF